MKMLIQIAKYIIIIHFKNFNKKTEILRQSQIWHKVIFDQSVRTQLIWWSVYGIKHATLNCASLGERKILELEF